MCETLINNKHVISGIEKCLRCITLVIGLDHMRIRYTCIVFIKIKTNFIILNYAAEATFQHESNCL